MEVGLLRAITPSWNDGFQKYLTQMLTLMRQCVACKNCVDTLKGVARKRGQRSNFVEIGLVWAITPLWIDVFQKYLAQMLTLMRRCVACKNFVVTLKGVACKLGQRSNFVEIGLVPVIIPPWIDGFQKYLGQMLTLMRRCVSCKNCVDTLQGVAHKWSRRSNFVQIGLVPVITPP